MTRLMTTGFDVATRPTTALTTGEGDGIFYTGTVAGSTSPRHSPFGEAIQCNASGDFVSMGLSVAAVDRDYFIRVHFYVQVIGSAGVIVRLSSSWSLNMNNDGTLQLKDSAGSDVGSASAALSTNV